MIKNGRGKFCSKECRQKYQVGKDYKTPESRLRISLAHSGKNHHAWNGGRYFDVDGYVLIHKPDHPFCQSKGTVFEHRLVMEKHIGRYLNSEEVCHHINGIKDDNRIENLMLFATHAEHIRYEHRSKTYASHR